MNKKILAIFLSVFMMFSVFRVVAEWPENTPVQTETMDNGTDMIFMKAIDDYDDVVGFYAAMFKDNGNAKVFIIAFHATQDNLIFYPTIYIEQEGGNSAKYDPIGFDNEKLTIINPKW